MKKEAKFAGADQRTPSVPQFFSWINSTNEGSTEAQTLTNLEYFRHMRETYGMRIAIYAWDAGNFDGASDGYGDVNSEKFRRQYPEGYRRVVEKAAALGIRLGLWGSPDGYGDDPETEKRRYDFFVHLCRDYHFAEFKLDGVCGQLRPEKAGLFAKMLQDCRKYSPDLIVLNHRLPLYEAEKYVTTYLWQGAESYTDSCCTAPENTAMHNRSYMFLRGHTPDLMRLTEDHGVCLSSSLDYFEDEMIYQAFGRSLILAPETYGNPWLLKDSEQPRLARIYNLHARVAPLLVDGRVLGEEYGCHAVSRGNGSRRFITTGNNSWRPMTIRLTVDESLGLTEQGVYEVILRHPWEERLAVLRWGESVEVELLPFRAALLEVSARGTAEPALDGMAYRVIREDGHGRPVEWEVLRNKDMDIREKAPVFLGVPDTVSGPRADDELRYETAMFAICNDSLERRSLMRAGETSVSEIQACRDTFFAQETYALRGCENRAMFDGREDTFFDGQSRCYCDRDLRVDGGCLRVDLGEAVDCDRVEIVSFKPDVPTREVLPLLTPETGSFSADLAHWQTTGKAETASAGPYTQRVARFTVHTVYECPGEKVRTVYPVSGPVRYFRLPLPMDRIYSFRALRGEADVTPKGARANNMQAPYEARKTRFEKSCTVTLPEYRAGSRIAVAVNGFHGAEGVYAVLEAEGKLYGADNRSSAFKANNWEHCVLTTEKANTLFLPLPEGLAGKEVTVSALFNAIDDTNINVEAWLCDRHD